MKFSSSNHWQMHSSNWTQLSHCASDDPGCSVSDTIPPCLGGLVREEHVKGEQGKDLDMRGHFTGCVVHRSILLAQ